MPVEDAEISAFAKKAFVKQGMKIMEKAAVKKLDRAKGKVTAHIETDGKTETMEFDTVISAVGIVGNVEDLGLEGLGVKIDRTHVVTDEYLPHRCGRALCHRRYRRRAMACAQGQP